MILLLEGNPPTPTPSPQSQPGRGQSGHGLPTGCPDGLSFALQGPQQVVGPPEGSTGWQGPLKGHRACFCGRGRSGQGRVPGKPKCQPCSGSVLLASIVGAGRREGGR